MPTYKYMCDNCGSSFEVFQKMSESPLKHCSSCDTDSLHRVLSAGLAINFIGNGFYANDSKVASKPVESTSHASSCSCCSSSSCSSCNK
ncbi:MAG: FmdB family zinc ribbon protein [Treponema sp.]